MLVYRISRKVYIKDLSGMGAALYGGRWNPKGTPMVYASGSISLAILEYMVHNFHILKTAEICLSKIKLSSQSEVLTYDASDLPPQWNEHPESISATQDIGRQFLSDGKYHAMKVPSAIVTGEFNILLNPNHSDHIKTQIIEIIDPLRLDERLLNL